MAARMISNAGKNMIQFPDRSRCSNIQHVRQYSILVKSDLVISEKTVLITICSTGFCSIPTKKNTGSDNDI